MPTMTKVDDDIDADAIAKVADGDPDVASFYHYLARRASKLFDDAIAEDERTSPQLGKSTAKHSRLLRRQQTIAQEIEAAAREVDAAAKDGAKSAPLWDEVSVLTRR